MRIRKLHGINAPHRKHTAYLPSERMAPPAEVVIPMSMHIGAPAKLLVKVGDQVQVGQMIAEASGFLSAPIHASVSGKVKKLDEIISAAGRNMTAAVIASDGLQTPYEGIQPPQVTNMQEFLDAVRDSGVVGLGGAGFPTSVKLNVKHLSQIKAIIINGAECEPYITSDTRTLLERADELWDGIALLQKYLEAKRVVIAIEDNKPKSIELHRKRCENATGVEVFSMPSMYPQGGEKMLVYNVLGEAIPEGKLPLDAGAIVINCTTLASIAHYIKTGMPLVEKCVTVDGSAVQTPKNLIVPIGTHLQDVFDACGGFRSEPRKVLYGGPMMGIAVPDLTVPILKNTNAVLAFDEKEAKPWETTACIKCGRCIAHCPMNLMATEIETAYNLKKPEDLEKLKVNLCIECGCCSYVCPAKRPLVQTNKLAKAMLQSYKKLQEEAKKAKEAQGQTDKEAPKK